MTIDLSSRFFRRLVSILVPGPATTRIAELYCYSVLIKGDFKVFAEDLKKYRNVIDWMKCVKRLTYVWQIRYWEPPPNIPETLQYDYDVRIVPYRAQHPGPLAMIVHMLLRYFKIVFIVNMISGMGHNTVELDYFLRLSQSKRIPRKRYVLLRTPSPFHDDTVALYRQHFWFASNGALLANFLAPVIARYKDIRLNVGLSRLRWQLPDDGIYREPPPGQTYFYQVSKAENRVEWMRYCTFRHETRNLFPLKQGLTIEPALADFLGGRHDKLALIHLKYHVVNATARPTDPDTYIPAIRWLQQNGYKVVFFGREKMPEQFAALGVLDYANSPIACYRFDLELTAIAAVAITAGSGIAMMPDCMGVPLVYLNSWHMGMPLASERCVMVPTLVVERGSDHVLTISEQCELYWGAEDKGAEVFPLDHYEPREASGDEVLEALKEVLTLTPELTPRQQAYYAKIRNGASDVIDARISRYFIDKHASLLEDAEESREDFFARTAIP